jgi:hypothetical protein
MVFGTWPAIRREGCLAYTLLKRYGGLLHEHQDEAVRAAVVQAHASKSNHPAVAFQRLCAGAFEAHP